MRSFQRDGAVRIDGQAGAHARIAAHVRMTWLSVEQVRHVVADGARLGGFVDHGVAAVFGGRVGRIVFLVLLLDFMSGKRARRRATDGRQGLALAATDLVAQQSTNDAADHGTANLILVLVGFLMHDLDVLAYLMGVFGSAAPGDRLYRHDLGELLT